MYTLIYFLSFYDIEGQKRRANDIDIKKKVSLSGRPSKGNGKGIQGHEQARARELNKKGPHPFSLSLPYLNPFPFPFESLPRRPRKR